MAAGARELVDLRRKGESPIDLMDYLVSAEFWFESFQNWQSEFLAVLSLVVLSIWLRQKDSPQSKPLEAPHSQTRDLNASRRVQSTHASLTNSRISAHRNP